MRIPNTLGSGQPTPAGPGSSATGATGRGRIPRGPRTTQVERSARSPFAGNMPSPAGAALDVIEAGGRVAATMIKIEQQNQIRDKQLEIDKATDENAKRVNDGDFEPDGSGGFTAIDRNDPANADKPKGSPSLSEPAFNALNRQSIAQITENITFDRVKREVSSYGEGRTLDYLPGVRNTAVKRLTKTSLALWDVQRKDLLTARAEYLADLTTHTDIEGHLPVGAPLAAQAAQRVDDNTAKLEAGYAELVNLGVMLPAEAKLNFENDKAQGEAAAIDTVLSRHRDNPAVLRKLNEKLLNRNDEGLPTHFQNLDGELRQRKTYMVQRAIDRIVDRRDVELSADVADAISVLRLPGKTPPNLPALQSRAEGTKLEKPLREAIQNQQALAEFTAQPLHVQTDILQEAQAQKTMTGQEADLFTAAQKIYSDELAAVEKGDGLAVAERYGHIEPVGRIVYTNPETLVARSKAATTASKNLGVEVSPLKSHEVAALTTDLDKLDPKQAAERLKTIHSSFTFDQSMEVARTFAKGDRPEFAVAMLRMSTGDETIARGIIGGGRLRREKGANLQLSAENKRTSVSSTYNNLFEGGDASPLSQFVAAADALYASRMIPQGKFAFESDMYEEALRDAAGGIIDYNGRNIIPPRSDYTDDDMENVINKLTDEDLIARSVGHGLPQATNGEVITAAQFKGTDIFGILFSGVQLASAGPGIYHVILPGLGYIQDSVTGGPYTIDLNGMSPR